MKKSLKLCDIKYAETLEVLASFHAEKTIKEL